VSLTTEKKSVGKPYTIKRVEAKTKKDANGSTDSKRGYAAPDVRKRDGQESLDDQPREKTARIYRRENDRGCSMRKDGGRAPSAKVLHRQESSLERNHLGVRKDDGGKKHQQVSHKE